MAERAKETRDRPSGDADYDPVEFSRKVRQFAIDAHPILFCPDGPIDEVLGLQRQLWTLLREAPGSESSGIHRYLLAVRGVLGDRLQSWAEDLESLVA